MTSPIASRKSWRAYFTGLWRQPDFLKLWAGQTISEFGSLLGALSLLAILTLNATPAQMGLLETLRSAPALVMGLFAGVWVDRLRRRPLLILADVGRFLLLALVVLVAFLGVLRMETLYVAAFLVGCLTVLFNIAYHSFVPTLVKRDHLVEANGKLGTTASLAEITAPGVGGILVQLISAPMTLLLDAISFLASALFVARIQAPEPPVARLEQPPVWRDAVAGLRLVLAHPLLRATAASTATWSFFGSFFGALYGLYVLREVGLSPVLLGVLIGSGGIGALVGAMLVNRVTRRLGIGRTLISALLFMGVVSVLVPLAAGFDKGIAAVLLLVSQMVGDVAVAIYLISELSLRQAVTPDEKLGRVNASFAFIVGGIGTLGLLTGGLLGQAVGLRPALAIAIAGTMLASLWLVFSPVRRLREVGV